MSESHKEAKGDTNIPTITGYASAAFTGDIALFNFYGGQILTQPEINDAYAAVIPEPSAVLLSFVSLGFALRRRR